MVINENVEDNVLNATFTPDTQLSILLRADNELKRTAIQIATERSLANMEALYNAAIEYARVLGFQQ